MIENFDPMGAAGMLFAIAFIALTLWFVATMGKKGMDYQQTKELAKLNSDREQAYRELAEQAARAQAETAEQLKHLANIEARLAEVERMLREVDEPAIAR